MENVDENDEKLLNDNGWEVESYSPFEIRTKDGGSFASGQGAYMVLYGIQDDIKPSPTYFLLRKGGCRSVDQSDIIGITTDEDYAKSKKSVFCYYEPIISLDR